MRSRMALCEHGLAQTSMQFGMQLCCAGGAGPIAAHNFKFSGIRNGIDPDLWDTESNMFLETGYDAETVIEV